MADGDCRPSAGRQTDCQPSAGYRRRTATRRSGVPLTGNGHYQGRPLKVEFTSAVCCHGWPFRSRRRLFL
jgi:hypothetical protein